MLVVYFLGAVWAAGSAVASGLFVPMLLIGSCVGRIVGLICVDIAAAGGHGSSGYDPLLLGPPPPPPSLPSIPAAACGPYNRQCRFLLPVLDNVCWHLCTVSDMCK